MCKVLNVVFYNCCVYVHLPLSYIYYINYCTCYLLLLLVRCQVAFRCRRVMTIKLSLIKV